MDALAKKIINGLNNNMETHLVAAANTEHDFPFSVLLVVLPAIREVLALRVGHTIWATQHPMVCSVFALSAVSRDYYS